MAAQTFAQRLSRYAQKPRRHALIAVRATQGLSDQRLLGILERGEPISKLRHERNGQRLRLLGHSELRIAGNGLLEALQRQDYPLVTGNRRSRPFQTRSPALLMMNKRRSCYR